MSAQPVTQPTMHRLAVPGAELHYEVRGSGPLLLVVGQPMTSDPFAPLADALASDRTVVTYDPRGVGRSTATDRDADITPEDEADDLAAIIEAVGGAPADVVGSSGGAVAGLALVVRRPDLVRTLVAHEPPLPELLPDAAHVRSAVDAVQDAFRAGGAGAAWGGFVALVMHDGVVGPDGPAPAAWPPPGGPHGDAGDAPPEPTPAQQRDDETFFLHMLKPFTRWVPPLEPLREHGGVRIAVGAASREEITARGSRALAGLLGATPLALPGGHAGFLDDVAGFAAGLRAALARD